MRFLIWGGLGAFIVFLSGTVRGEGGFIIGFDYSAMVWPILVMALGFICGRSSASRQVADLESEVIAVRSNLHAVNAIGVQSMAPPADPGFRVEGLSGRAAS